MIFFAFILEILVTIILAGKHSPECSTQPKSTHGRVQLLSGSWIMPDFYRSGFRVCFNIFAVVVFVFWPYFSSLNFLMDYPWQRKDCCFKPASFLFRTKRSRTAAGYLASVVQISPSAAIVDYTQSLSPSFLLPQPLKELCLPPRFHLPFLEGDHYLVQSLPHCQFLGEKQKATLDSSYRERISRITF